MVTQHNTSAHHLSSHTRKHIALDALGGMPITHIADKHKVCRNSVYKQKATAHDAINDAFDDQNDDQVLFYVPVTKGFIHQMVTALACICKSSYRDIIQFLRDIFDFSIALGTISDIMRNHSRQAAIINQSYDVSKIIDSSSDEVFHRNDPILAVIDIPSRYCALLSKEDDRDADTWGVALLSLQEGYSPTVNISDHTSGIKKAFEDQLPDTALRYDHFHLLKAMNELIRFLKNRKKSSLTVALKLYTKVERAANPTADDPLTKELAEAEQLSIETEWVFQQVSTLCSWLQYDVLQLPGYQPEAREALYDFIVDELARLSKHHGRIANFIASLSYQKPHLLAMSHDLEDAFIKIANDYQLPVNDLWAICYNTRFDGQAANYHIRSSILEDKIGDQYDEVEDKVLAAMAATPRCSSMVENFNSRLKPYLDERKPVPRALLPLLQFVLNHRPFQRSYHDHLRNKTPAEVMTGKPHPHWLEMLGYKRFKRAA